MHLRIKDYAALAIASVTVALMIAVTFTQSILRFEIDGVRNDDGVIHILVFDDAQAFDRSEYTRVFKYATLPARAGRMNAKIDGVGPGRYAVMVHHDENGNERLDMDGESPVEGWAYTGSAGAEAVPTFAAAAFDHTPAASPVPIAMLYAN